MKHKLDLALALPKDAAECDACAARLVDALLARNGVARAHVDLSTPGQPKLCIHYEPTAVRLSELEALIERAGASVESRYAHVSVPAVGLRHERQARRVEQSLARNRGIIAVSAALGSRRLYVEFDPSMTTKDAVHDAIAKSGLSSYEESASPAAAADEGDDHEHDHGGPFGERSELVFSLACGALTLAGWVVARTSAPPLVSTSIFILAYVLGGWFTTKEVFEALRARTFQIDFLMLLAAIGAALLGEWLEGALLLFLFTLGHSLEGYAMRRARNAISALAKLAPDTALRLGPDSGEQEVPVAELARGDRILVKPNTRIPADGFVSAGASSVDQAPITGESVPVEKRPAPDPVVALGDPDALPPEHRVYAGTVNGAAALTIVVTKTAGESTLARVVKLVAEAETQKSPTQQFTERFERIFVPVILLTVGALLFAWTVIDEPFARSFYRAMAVLVAASPCALAIATPSAVLSGVARAARSGVLVKGGVHLESLGLVRAIAFDKTGTLTEGKPVLTDTRPLPGVDETTLMRVAVALESRSDHPIAAAIVAGRKAGEPQPEAATDVEALVGYGVRGAIGSSRVTIAKPGYFEIDGRLDDGARKVADELQANGRTVMIVKMDDQFLGVLGVMDKPHENAREVLSRLHALGVEQTIMLTGDNQRVADAVAKEVGIRLARGDLLPEQKVAAIAELAKSKQLVAMVGDGVNDAPAMANATVGIAMGAGGSDVALETADVALMADDLRTLPFAVGLSRAARRIIRQNLWASLGMVGFLVPATIFGFAGIGAAVALHEGSTLLVVFNALRLLAYDQTSRAG